MHGKHDPAWPASVRLKSHRNCWYLSASTHRTISLFFVVWWKKRTKSLLGAEKMKKNFFFPPPWLLNLVFSEKLSLKLERPGKQEAYPVKTAPLFCSHVKQVEEGRKHLRRK